MVQTYAVQDALDSDSSSCDDHHRHDDGGNNDYHPLAKKLCDQLDETHFHEFDEELFLTLTHSECCSNASTAHEFFGATATHFLEKSRKKTQVTFAKRCPLITSFGLMIDNGSTGPIYSEEKLIAYREASRKSSPMKNMKNYACVPAHGGSKCIGMATSLGGVLVGFTDAVGENHNQVGEILSSNSLSVTL